MDDLLKLCEFGALGLITAYLLVRGVATINKFSDSVNILAASVKDLAEKVTSMDSHINFLELQFKGIETRLDKIESQFSDLRHFIEFGKRKKEG